MRRTLINQLLKQDDENTYFLTADVGYGLLEPLKEKMGDRLINIGIAEPSMINIAAGLALAGKKVYTYTMCCFYLKCIEEIKLDLCAMNLPVTMIGVGTGFDYEQHGISHFALEDERIIDSLLNVDVTTPQTKDDLVNYLKTSDMRFPFSSPAYLRVGRFGEGKEFGTDLHIRQKYPTEGGSLDYYKKAYGYINNLYATPKPTEETNILY